MALPVMVKMPNMFQDGADSQQTMKKIQNMSDMNDHLLNTFSILLYAEKLHTHLLEINTSLEKFECFV